MDSRDNAGANESIRDPLGRVTPRGWWARDTIARMASPARAAYQLPSLAVSVRAFAENVDCDVDGSGAATSLDLSICLDTLGESDAAFLRLWDVSRDALVDRLYTRVLVTAGSDDDVRAAAGVFCLTGLLMRHAATRLAGGGLESLDAEQTLFADAGVRRTWVKALRRALHQP